MNATIELRRTDDGAILARRLDGRPLTPEDKAEARRLASEQVTPDDPGALIDGDVQAVLIDSTVLGAAIWFAMRDGWQPDKADNLPIFYASELPALRVKTPDQLRSIFNVKTAFGGGRVTQ